VIASVLAEQNPGTADAILWAFPASRRQTVLDAAPPEYREQWQRNHAYPEGSIGRLMDPPLAVIEPTQTVREIVEWLRPIVKCSEDWLAMTWLLTLRIYHRRAAPVALPFSDFHPA
jgi:Mg/Co/Ni transporter MgtE